MEAYTTPGQDFFEALQAEAKGAAPEHAARAVEAIYEPTRGGEWTWGMMPAHVKAIFSAAAARFLAE